MHPLLTSALADQIVRERSLAGTLGTSAPTTVRRTRRRRVFRAPAAVRRTRHLGIFDA